MECNFIQRTKSRDLGERVKNIGSKTELELELPMKEVVQTHIIPCVDDIDPDVLSNMTSLGCFKDKEKLVKELLSTTHNTEKVIYFLLLDRKRRKPSYEDETEIIIRNRSESADPPRKRVDTCQVNGRSGPRYSFDMLSDGSPITPRRYPYGMRRGSGSGCLHPGSGIPSPAVSPLNSPRPSPRGATTPDESPLNTPPGSPSLGQPYWRSRLHTIKNSFLGSPRFHRRKLQVPSASDEVSLTPDSSPDLSKRSWFGGLMANEREESHVILVKDRPLSSVKADLIHAFLSIADLSHSVVSPMSFRVEYKRPGSTTMFQRNVRFHVDISIVGDGSPNGGASHDSKPSVQSGRFKRICEHIQAQILGRRPGSHSPRFSRRPPTSELSDSSSCGSESLSPTQVADDLAHVLTTTSGQAPMARCKSDQDAACDIFEREAKAAAAVAAAACHRRAVMDGTSIANGRRLSYDLKGSRDKV
ncbi:hypothetical protein MTO96_014978 [Rhipicephalus appendiculatus]